MNINEDTDEILKFMTSGYEFDKGRVKWWAQTIAENRSSERCNTMQWERIKDVLILESLIQMKR